MTSVAQRASMGPTLAAFVAGVNFDLSIPAEETPRAVQNRLQSALGSDLFFDCADLLLRQVVQEPQTRFLFADPESRYTLQLFCWPPGFGNEPHLHTMWTVSGVMAGELLVFRSNISEEDCRSSIPLLVKSGSAGALSPPQYHCLKNTSAQTSITIHVFAIDQFAADQSMGSSRATARITNNGILTLATEAARHKHLRCGELLWTAFAAAGTSTKLEILKLMVAVDPREAVRMATRLAEIVGGRDGDRLMSLVAAINCGRSAAFR